MAVKGKCHKNIAMKYIMPYFVILFILGTLPSFVQKGQPKLPFKAAGLNERQAAEHLLSRFTFGVRSEDIDDALKMGLEKWFSAQLDGKIEDIEVQKRLADYNALSLTNAEIVAKYPLGAQLKARAIEDGLIKKEDINEDKEKQREIYKQLMEKYGIQNSKELERQTINQKIIRAIYSKNQLHEVLTDFWFNHFNIFMGKNTCTQFVMSYERDAIRPNVNRSFKDLLIATAKSPAMLTYLDNFLSTREDESMGNMQAKGSKRPKGLNENYAREIMELHTLGVDGGYTQDDVLNAAKILTGWTIYPMGQRGESAKIAKLLEKIGEDRLANRGFVHENDFLFAPNRHEEGSKTVMGKQYNQGGYDEGIALLNDLAAHPSTARFICKKLATRFVSDSPDPKIVDRMVKTFIDKDGDIQEVLWTMVTSPEFWQPAALHQKTKSPFEYAISAVRSMHADVMYPFPLANWITKMGQKIYYYQAPTGFPDKGQYWINTGSLLNRMNFGLDLAAGKIPGIKIDNKALLDNKEPESAEDAIKKYAAVFLPERKIESTVDRLLPLATDPTFSEKVIQANKKNKSEADEMTDETSHNEMVFDGNKTLSQVLGILIGSPEFQRK
jgi:uncharacterized protein (DUF1800 family)